MKNNLLLTLLCLVSFHAIGHEYRDLLQKETTEAKLQNLLIDKSEWISYPDYNDRSGWSKLAGKNREEIIKRGEKALDYQWQVVTASQYLEFEKSGSRNIMQKPFGANTSAIEAVVLAELVEGKGRFLPKIIDGVWFSCEMTSWVLSAHVSRAQPEKTSLPSHRTDIIDLSSGDFSSLLAWTYYFLHEEFDKVQPLISQRLYDNLERRILKPYVERSNFWWQAFDAKPSTMVNNWNPWCNFNVLVCYLLLENDKEALSKAVYRTMVSVDKFINYTKSDGACEEGPSYWGHAAGKMFDYLSVLNKATDGQINIFDQPIIKNMGEYIANSYVGSGWVVNFADASAKTSGGSKIGTIWRYGEAVSSEAMKNFASNLAHSHDKPFYHAGRDIFCSLENLTCEQQVLQTSTELASSDFVWYPETEFCYIKNNKGMLLATKGGYNNESHNHNDMGTFSLYIDETPMIIDVGVGTYTRQTFSSERYKIWTMQSDFHNLPKINGVSQKYGSNFRSANVKTDERKKTFSLDLQDAYPSTANVTKWTKSFELKANGGLQLEDRFLLNKTNNFNELNFLTWGKPTLSKDGSIEVKKNNVGMAIQYNASQFNANIETIELVDPRLSNVWGKEIYRVTLKAKKKELKGKYNIEVNRL